MRAAKRHQVVSVLRLAELSAKPHLTEAEKLSLPRLRKAAHQAVQYECRLARRTAKRTGQVHVPMLMRGSFKKTLRSAEVRQQQCNGRFRPLRELHGLVLSRGEQNSRRYQEGAGETRP